VSAALPLVDQTADTGRTSIIRLILSFPVALGCLLIVLATSTVRSRFDDPDMWWHLKTGRIIWTTHTIPTTDVFSYTTHHHAYVAHEWLSQLLIYGAYKIGGYPGLMLWFCCFTSALLIAGYILCSLYANNPKTGLLGAMTIWIFATVGLAIRPQMIGYLLLIIELLLIHLGRTRNRRWFFALPPLFAVWVNCHGSFFLGLLVGGAFLLSSFSYFQVGSLISPRWATSVRRTFSQMMALSVLALFCNPIGFKQVLYPLDTLLHQAVGLSQVEEWQPLQITDMRGFALLGILASIALIVIVRHSELMWHELLTLAMGTWLAVSHRRMLFVFGILAAPVLSRLLSDFWDGFSLEKDHPIPNSILITASLLIVVWMFPSQAALAKQVSQGSPVKAVEFIKVNHLSGRMLNEYVYGGYLIWAAPENPVFVDGRADVFEWTGVLAELTRWERLEENPNALLEKYQIDFCLLARRSPMVTVMSLLKDWRIAYQDDDSVIFTRTASGGAPANNEPNKN
jgi:hypothetical protein